MNCCFLKGHQVVFFKFPTSCMNWAIRLATYSTSEQKLISNIQRAYILHIFSDSIPHWELFNFFFDPYASIKRFLYWIWASVQGFFNFCKVRAYMRAICLKKNLAERLIEDADFWSDFDRGGCLSFNHTIRTLESTDAFPVISWRRDTS